MFIYLYPLISLIVFFLLLVGTYLWFFKTAMFASFFLGMGIIVRMHRQLTIDRLLNSHRVGYGLILLFIGMIATDIFLVKNIGAFASVSGFSCYPFFIVEAFVSVALLLWVSNQWKHYNRFILFVGENSLLYYFFQRQAYLLIDKLLKQLGVGESSLLWASFEMFGAMLLLAIPIWIVNRLLPFMAGKCRIRHKL